MKYAADITDEDKATFLEMIYAGHKANTAAAYIDTTGTVMRRLKRPGAEFYDEQFAADWLKAEKSEEHRVNREEELRALVDERSRTSDTILVKRMLTELPEYEVLRHQNFRHDITVTLAERLPALSLEELQQLRTLVEAGEPDLKLLPPAPADAA